MLEEEVEAVIFMYDYVCDVALCSNVATPALAYQIMWPPCFLVLLKAI